MIASTTNMVCEGEITQVAHKEDWELTEKEYLEIISRKTASLCGACYEACPVRIDLPKLLIRLRRDMIRGGVTKWRERLAYKIGAMGLRYTPLYKFGGMIQRKILRSMADSDGYIREGSGPLANWTKVRDMPAPAKSSFRDWWNKERSGS